MVSTIESETTTLAGDAALIKAKAVRRQASDLLRRLIASREQSERRMAELGRRDPLKCITGRSSLDEAIAGAKAMIANMDGLLARMEDELDSLAAPVATGGGSEMAHVNGAAL